MGDKNSFADAKLASEMSSFKEPSVRLKQVQGEGAKCLEDGDLEKALFLGMQQLALAKLCYEDPATPDKELMMGKAHYNLSLIYYEMGLGDQSLYHAQKALERVDPRKTGEGENNDFTVSTMMAVARAMIQRCDPKCVNYLQRALVINNALNGPDHDSNFPIHEGFGDFYVLLGDSRLLYKESTKPKKEGSVDVNAKKKEKEPDDYDKAMDEYATAYSKIAGGGKDRAFYWGLGSTKDARMGDMFGRAAKTRSKMGNDDEAAVIYEKAVACLECAFKPNKMKIAQMCYELGVTYHKTAQYSYSKDALNKAAGHCGGNGDGEKGAEPLLMLIRMQQAITMYDGNEVEAAKTTFEGLVALQKKEYGGNSIIVAETLKYLGDVHMALKNRPLASKFYNRALRVLRRRLGSIDQTVKQLEQYIKQLNLKD